MVRLLTSKSKLSPVNLLKAGIAALDTNLLSDGSRERIGGRGSLGLPKSRLGHLLDQLATGQRRLFFEHFRCGIQSRESLVGRRLRRVR